jgi:hypothetical protein
MPFLERQDMVAATAARGLAATNAINAFMSTTSVIVRRCNGADPDRVGWMTGELSGAG